MDRDVSISTTQLQLTILPNYFFFYIVKGIFRQAMHEMPLITICSPFCILGLGLIAYHTYRYEKNDGNNKKYKLKYTRTYDK